MKISNIQPVSSFVPLPDCALAVAARYEIMLLMRQKPNLWPQLNTLTLNTPIDWPSVLAVLRRAVTSAAMCAVVTLGLCSSSASPPIAFDAERVDQKAAAVATTVLTIIEDIEADGAIDF
jgi:hypothetical protein